MSGLRMTPQTEAVLKEMLQKPTQDHYGLTLGKAAELPSGTIHPILARLERAGILESFWEDPEKHAAAHPSRPRRRYYKFTTNGAEQARVAIADAYSRRSRRTGTKLAPSPSTGQ
ncbi:PadR family transcriptional regulator [Streptomyces sp. LN325]|uniref:PadR family transcriptional regulator n=1 Tax=Streptomyces sp. LN325 TaxID=3112976 RepID=UPI00371D9B79